jgi:hypothetical protein
MATSWDSAFCLVAYDPLGINLEYLGQILGALVQHLSLISLIYMWPLRLEKQVYKST